MLSYVVNETYMDWYPSVLHSIKSEYYELFEKWSLWVGILEHSVYAMNFKALKDDTNILLFNYNHCSTL